MCSHLRTQSISNFYASCIRRYIFVDISVQKISRCLLS
jgi:hypothetical protein